MSTMFYPPVGSALARVDTAEGVSYGSKCVVIDGVVSPIGQGGWPGQDGYDVHNFTFAGWRHLGEPLVVRELTLLRPVPPFSEGHKVFEQLPAYSIQRLSVLLSTDQTRAVVEKVLTIGTPDEPLRLFSERLRAPVIFHTRQFGDLVLNPVIDRFEGEARWNRRTIEFHFEKGDNGEIEEAIKTAESICSNQARWKRIVDEFAVAELLPLKNESWLDEDEEELTPSDFKSRMELISISFARGGQFEFWHADGGMFSGHSIHICGNLEDGLTHADIQG